MRFSLRRILPKTLFARSLLILVIPAILVQVISTWVFFDRHWSRVTSRLSASVAGEIVLIADLYENGYDFESNEQKELLRHALEMSIRFKKGGELNPSYEKKFSYSWESLVARSLLEELKSRLKRPFVLNIDLNEKAVVVSVQLINGILIVGFPGGRLFSSSSYIFLLWMMGVSIVLVCIAIVFMRNQIRPIRKLSLAMTRFGKGHSVDFLKISGAREVRQAGKAFIEMKKNIQRNLEQRTLMLAGVSHDLRTPLTRMKLQLALLEQSDDIQEMKNDIIEMERMIEGYLEFVREGADEEMSLVDLHDLVIKVVASLSNKALNVENEILKGTFINVPCQAFERCLVNILLNADRYADKVRLSAYKGNDFVELTIEDNGPGIPESEKENVFRPFYRIDNSRNSKTGGVGLGLSIVQDTLNGIGGTVALGKSDMGGLKVILKIPA